MYLKKNFQPSHSLRKHPEMVSAEEHHYKEVIDHLLGKRHWKKLILAWFEMGAQEVQENFQWEFLAWRNEI